jgi:arylsulfatase
VLGSTRRLSSHSLRNTPTIGAGGEIIKVVFDVADDAYIDVERHLAAAMSRD